MAQNTGINSLDAGAPNLRLTGDQRPQEDSIRMRIKQIAEQSGHPESFPATDSDFAALAQLSDSPDDFPSTDYDFEVILRIAKEPIYSTPEKSKAEIYANYMAQGGRIGFLHGSQGPPAESDRGRDDPTPSDVGSGGGAQYRGGETYMAPVDVTSTYTTTAPTTDDETAKEKYISEQYKKKRDIYGDADLEEQLEIDKRIAQRKLDYGLNLTKQEKKNLEVGLGFRPAKTKNKFLSFLGNAALAIIPGLLPAKLATTFRVGKLGYDLAYTDKYDAKLKFLGINKKDLLSKANEKRKTEKAEQDLINSLPRGHPERIQLEELKKEKTTPKDGPDGEVVTQDTSITIDAEEVNDAKTQLLRKYQEMNEASRLAWLRQQQMNRDKQMAYYRMMMKPYFTGAAQGGRVPAGYNTGGLSNLFRLKNR